MGVVRLCAHGELRFHDEPQLEPVTGETLLQVKVISVCGSDLRWLSEGDTQVSSSPRIKFESMTSNHGR